MCDRPTDKVKVRYTFKCRCDHDDDIEKSEVFSSSILLYLHWALCLDFDFIRSRHTTPNTYSCFYFRFFAPFEFIFLLLLGWLGTFICFFLLLLLLRNFSLILCFLFLYFLPSISISFSFIFFTFYVYMTFRSRFNFFLIFLIFAVCVRVYITAL